MACSTLVPADEVFGPAFEPPVVGASLGRGEWFGVTLAERTGMTGQWLYVTVPKTYDIAGVSITADPPTSGMVTISVPVAGATITVPFQSPAAGFTNITAARFRAVEYLVIAVTERSFPPTIGGTPTAYDVTYYVMRTSGPPAGAVKLGPFRGVEASREANFCHNRRGDLMMVWWGVSPPQVQGRFAHVRRTEMPSSRQADLLTVNDPNAVGTLGCQVSAAARSVTVFDSANRQGNTAVSRTAGSRNLMSAALPAPGRLRLSDSNLRIAATATRATFDAINDGGDFLEITGVSVAGGRVTVATGLALPVCLAPGDTLPIVVTRIPGATPGNSSVTVTSVPAPNPASTGVVQVMLVAGSATAPQPAIRFEPAGLFWLPSDSTSKSVSVRNIGNVSVDVEVAPSPAGVFTWGALPRTSVAPGGLLPIATVTIVRPPGASGQLKAMLPVTALNMATGVALNGSPFSVQLTANPVDPVPIGALRIAGLVGDAPGNDLLPEGEFIDIVNTTSGPLDLNGCLLRHLVFAKAGALPGSGNRPGTSGSAEAVRLNATTMSGRTTLGAFDSTGEVLRILTRAHSGMAGDAPPGPLRVFIGRSVPIWNNAGDTATLFNRSGELVASYSYVARYPAPGTTVQPNTVVVPPPARRRIMTRRIFVNTAIAWNTVFDVMDGDVVHIRNATGTANFGGLAGNWGPSGNGTDADSNLVPIPFRGDFPWPMPGAPQCCLLVRLGEDLFIRRADTDTTITVISSSDAPLALTLGVNDCWVADNSGYFDCVVDLYR